MPHPALDIKRRGGRPLNTNEGTTMSWQAYKWAKAQDIDDSTMKLLLVVLAEYANEKTGQCWYKQEDLAKDISKTTRTVRRALVSLREMNLIHTEQLRSKGGNGRLLITVLMDSAHAAPDRTQVSASGGHGCPHPPDTGVRTDRTIASAHKPLIEPSIEPSREPTPLVRSDKRTRTVDEFFDDGFLAWQEVPNPTQAALMAEVATIAKAMRA